MFDVSLSPIIDQCNKPRDPCLPVHTKWVSLLLITHIHMLMHETSWNVLHSPCHWSVIHRSPRVWFSSVIRSCYMTHRTFGQQFHKLGVVDLAALGRPCAPAHGMVEDPFRQLACAIRRWDSYNFLCIAAFLLSQLHSVCVYNIYVYIYAYIYLYYKKISIINMNSNNNHNNITVKDLVIVVSCLNVTRRLCVFWRLYVMCTMIVNV